MTDPERRQLRRSAVLHGIAVAVFAMLALSGASAAAPGLYGLAVPFIVAGTAGAVGAARLLALTDVPGVLDKQGVLIPELTASQVRALAADGTISGGMIPKLETCLMAVERGVEAAVILDGRVPHAMLLEIFTPQGVGTLVTKG